MMLITPHNNQSQIQHKNQITLSLKNNSFLLKKQLDFRNFNTERNKCLLSYVMASREALMIWVSYIKESKLSSRMQVFYLQGVMKLTQKLIFKKWVKDLLIKSKDTLEVLWMKIKLFSILLAIVWAESLQEQV